LVRGILGEEKDQWDFTAWCVSSLSTFKLGSLNEADENRQGDSLDNIDVVRWMANSEDGKPILLSESFGSVPDQHYPPPPFKDTFSASELDPSWYQLRIPYTKNYETGKPQSSNRHHGKGNNETSGLRFSPNVFSLSDRDTPAAILRKQKSLNMTFSATLLPASDHSAIYKV